MNLKNFYSLVNKLKQTKRQGWLDRGLKADTIASHNYGVNVIAWVLASEEKVDISKVLEMTVIHDLVMAKMEDVTPSSGKYLNKRDLEKAAKVEVAKLLSSPLNSRYLELF